jgi:hypothetical protein
VAIFCRVDALCLTRVEKLDNIAEVLTAELHDNRSRRSQKYRATTCNTIRPLSIEVSGFSRVCYHDTSVSWDTSFQSGRSVVNVESNGGAFMGPAV